MDSADAIITIYGIYIAIKYVKNPIIFSIAIYIIYAHLIRKIFNISKKLGKSAMMPIAFIGYIVGVLGHNYDVSIPMFYSFISKTTFLKGCAEILPDIHYSNVIVSIIAGAVPIYILQKKKMKKINFNVC